MKKLMGLVGMLLLLHSSQMMAQTFPDDSIFQLESDWQTVNEDKVKLSHAEGKIQVVAFIYSYCQHSCPVIMQRLKQIEKNLAEGVEKHVQFTLFTLDPIRDTPSQLKAFAIKNELDLNSWQLLRGEADDILELAAVMSVKYKAMNNEEQDIAHSNVITVINAQGQITHQVKGLGEQLSEAVKAIESLVD